jgi:hypothetical protein
MFRTLLLALAVIGAGCGTEAYADGLGQTSPTSVVAQPAAAEAASDEASGGSSDAVPASQLVSPEVAGNRLAAQIVELPQAGGIPEVQQRSIPVSVSFEKIGVVSAPIDPVGVLDNGEMQIPGARRVGWYEYGPAPGETGSAVLAAHIAFDGERGIFRFLGDSEVGDRFTVAFDDGSQQSYEIFERAQYGKRELPFDRVFARDGNAVVTLISCGGTFQPALSSYEDNIVAYARAVD